MRPDLKAANRASVRRFPPPDTGEAAALSANGRAIERYVVHRNWSSYPCLHGFRRSFACDMHPGCNLTLRSAEWRHRHIGKNLPLTDPLLPTLRPRKLTS